MLDQPMPVPAPVPGPASVQAPGPVPAPPPSAARIAVVIKYARLYEGGLRRPMMCGPHRGVRKVIFDGQKAAEDCAVELAGVLGGEPQRAYPCERSRSGHFHLTTDLIGKQNRA